MFAGIVTVSVGHCHPRVNEALKAQLDTLWHTTSIYLQVRISLRKLVFSTPYKNIELTAETS